MSERVPSRRELVKPVAIRWLGFLVVIGAILFLPAGTFDYWQAWVYIAVVFIPFTCAVVYLTMTDPALIERRMRTREREQQQKWVVLLTATWFILVFLLPGFDRRFGWSHVPAGLVLAADALVFIGYVLIFFVLRENTFASRVVDVEQGQKVISSGPYAIVRHPMYLGTLVMFLCTPLALGSYWALVSALPLIPILGARIVDEERVLGAELPGYPEYMEKVRYRLVPRVW